MTDRSIAIIGAVVLVILALTALQLTRGGRGGGVLAYKRFEGLVSGAPQNLRVETNAINSDGWFRREYTCDGPDKTPNVVVKGIPSQAKAVALIMYDPDAPIGTFIHWLAVAPAKGGEIAFPTSNMVEGKNDFRRIGYGGPCPPRGHGPHRYYILVLALDKDPRLSRGFTLNALLQQAKGHVISWGYTMGRYQR